MLKGILNQIESRRGAFNHLSNFNYLDSYKILQRNFNSSKKSKIGMELELLTLNERFESVPRSDEILSTINEPWAVKESSHEIVEVISSAGKLEDVRNDLIQKIKIVDSVARDLDLRTLPLEVPLTNNNTKTLRENMCYQLRREIIDKNRINVCGNVLGTHIHFDWKSNEKDRIKQMNFLTAVDPFVVALTQCSPKNGFKSWRNQAYRRILHKDHPFQGQMQDFKEAWNDYERELETEFRGFVNLADRSERYINIRNKYNTIWGPVRVNPSLETVEIRSLGANPNLDLLFEIAHYVNRGMEAFVKNYGSIYDFLEDISPQDFRTVQSIDDLRKLSGFAIKDGLKDPMVYQYASNLFSFCRKGSREGLNGEIEKILSVRRSLSESIIEMNGRGENIHKRLYEDIYKNYLSTEIEKKTQEKESAVKV